MNTEVYYFMQLETIKGLMIAANVLLFIILIFVIIAFIWMVFQFKSFLTSITDISDETK